MLRRGWAILRNHAKHPEGPFCIVYSPKLCFLISGSTWWCHTSSCHLRCSSCWRLLCRTRICVRSEPRPHPLSHTPGWTHMDNPPSPNEHTAGPNVDLMDTRRHNMLPWKLICVLSEIYPVRMRFGSFNLKHIYIENIEQNADCNSYQSAGTGLHWSWWSRRSHHSELQMLLAPLLCTSGAFLSLIL